MSPAIFGARYNNHASTHLAAWYIIEHIVEETKFPFFHIDLCVEGEVESRISEQIYSSTVENVRIFILTTTSRRDCASYEGEVGNAPTRVGMYV